MGWPTGFGETIGLAVTELVEVPQALGDRLRHRRATAANEDEAGEIVPIGLRTGQQIDDHGWDVDPVRNAPAANGFPPVIAVPAGQDDHGRSGGDGAVETDHQSSDVEHRHGYQTDALGAEVLP